MGCQHSSKPGKKKASEHQPLRKSKDSDVSADIMSENKYSLEELSNFYERFRVEHPDGQITEAQLRKLYKCQYPDGNPNRFAKLMFKAFDTNGDGILDYREFLVGLGLVNGADTRMKLQWVFELWDEDKNGVITLDELVAFYRVVHSMIPGQNENPKKRAKKVFHQMDKNGDGRVCVHEFVESVMKNPEYIYPIPLKV